MHRIIRRMLGTDAGCVYTLSSAEFNIAGSIRIPAKHPRYFCRLAVVCDRALIKQQSGATKRVRRHDPGLDSLTRTTMRTDPGWQVCVLYPHSHHTDAAPARHSGPDRSQ